MHQSLARLGQLSAVGFMSFRFLHSGSMCNAKGEQHSGATELDTAGVAICCRVYGSCGFRFYGLRV